MQLITIVYTILIIILVIAIIVLSIFVLKKRKTLKSVPCVQRKCAPCVISKCENIEADSVKSVMGANINYKEEEQKKKTEEERIKYRIEAQNEIFNIFLVALIRWIQFPKRREIPIGRCEQDWRTITWKEQLDDVGFPQHLLDEFMEFEYRFIRNLKYTFHDFLTALQIPISTEKRFMDERLTEISNYLKYHDNFVASDKDKYLKALRQYKDLKVSAKSVKLDLESYGETNFQSYVCVSPQSTPSSTPTIPSAAPNLPQLDDDIENTISFKPYSMQQRIAFITLIVICIIVVISLIFAIFIKN